MIAAVTLDIVGSRALEDRAAAQRGLDAAIARAEEHVPLAESAFEPTVGDEQQARYPSLDAALRALLLIQLSLPEGVDCRFGIGLGEVWTVPSAGGDIPEGSAWWAAREAIETVHALQQRAVPAARTWVAVATDAGDGVRREVRSANAYLLTRDEIVQGMSERARRLAFDRCVGRTQKQSAADEGITQPAVSQLLATSGARAVVEGYRLLSDPLR
jgi:hypothetical protein